MTRAEVAALLAFAARWDKRTIGDADVAAWHDVLGDMPADWDRASGAIVAWYREHREPVAPSDVRAGMRGSGADRHPSSRPLRQVLAELEQATGGGTDLPALPAGAADRVAAEAAKTRLDETIAGLSARWAAPAATGYVPRRQRIDPRAPRTRRTPLPTRDAAGQLLTVCHRCVGDIPAPDGWRADDPKSPKLFCGPCTAERKREAG